MARKAKVTESTSTVESQDDGQQVEFEGGGLPSIELVDDPGPVKKIRFDGEPARTTAPPAAPEPARPEMQFRRAVASDRAEGSDGSEGAPGGGRVVREHTESIYSIREEVDHLGRPDPKFRGAPARSNLRSWKAETLYRTDRGGEVRAYDGPSGRTFALSDGKSERRFTDADVDRVIAGIRLDESRQERREASQGSDGEASTEAAETESPASRSSASRLFGFMGRRSRRKSGEAPADEEGEAASEAKEYQPQCSAVTDEGLQCRNSARSGSKYCSSHFGFQPRTAQGLHQARDTEPRYESSRDTLPGGAGWDPSQQGGHQCGAVTRDGKQCMNPVMAGSPYCGSHQEYEEPTPGEIVAATDTKPRWAKAKDTKPATRRSARPAKAAKKAGRRKA